MVNRGEAKVRVHMNVVPRSTRNTDSGLFMGLSSTLIYTSELILCATICVPSATRHNIHMILSRLQAGFSQYAARFIQATLKFEAELSILCKLIVVCKWLVHVLRRFWVGVLFFFKNNAISFQR